MWFGMNRKPQTLTAFRVTKASFEEDNKVMVGGEEGGEGEGW